MCDRNGLERFSRKNNIELKIQQINCLLHIKFLEKMNSKYCTMLEFVSVTSSLDFSIKTYTLGYRRYQKIHENLFNFSYIKIKNNRLSKYK